MKFKIDENLPFEVAQLLRQAGHDAATVFEHNLSGGSDPEIALACQRENRFLVTMDLGFADLRTYPPEQYVGIIVLRLKKQDRPHVLEILSRLTKVLESEPLDHHLWIVEEKRIRIRG